MFRSIKKKSKNSSFDSGLGGQKTIAHLLFVPILCSFLSAVLVQPTLAEGKKTQRVSPTLSRLAVKYPSWSQPEFIRFRRAILQSPLGKKYFRGKKLRATNDVKVIISEPTNGAIITSSTGTLRASIKSPTSLFLGVVIVGKKLGIKKLSGKEFALSMPFSTGSNGSLRILLAAFDQRLNVGMAQVRVDVVVPGTVGTNPQVTPTAQPTATSGNPKFCANEGQFCSFTGTQTVRYGANNSYFTKVLTGGTQCTNEVFGDPLSGTGKHCDIMEDATTPPAATAIPTATSTPQSPAPTATSTPQPPAATPAPTSTPQPGASNGLRFSQADYEAAIIWDFGGEHGKDQANPSAPSLGYPCGVPNSYSWKFSERGLVDVPNKVSGWGTRLAGAGYNQVYNVCSGPNSRKSMPNARVEFTDFIVDYYSISQNRWIRSVKQAARGAAFAEDFVNNEAAGADFRGEANGHNSVRSGIGNAFDSGGWATGRYVEDGAVGFNFHGFGNRFGIPWSDVKAVVVAQAMRCIPHQGSDLGDCNKLGYIGNVGLDSWATTSSDFDNFRTHGGVGGGVFKPVKTIWQIFTNYSGPEKFAGIPAPPVPQF